MRNGAPSRDVVSRSLHPQLRRATKARRGITLRGQPITVPYRIYNSPVPTERLASLSSHERIVLACIYTRHNDGRVRQAALRELLASDTWWGVPFIVQLLGEYVIEICTDIADFAADELPSRPAMLDEFRAFAADNPDFIALTKARATSYWAAYYRREHVWPTTYPALIALERLSGTVQ